MKNFDGWNKIKKKVEDRNRMIVKSGALCICNFGLNIGYETDGKDEYYIRPAFVLLGFGLNGWIVVPLTTIEKKSKFLIQLNAKSKINLSQIRYLDSKRFYREIEILDKQKRREILQKLFKIFI